SINRTTSGGVGGRGARAPTTDTPARLNRSTAMRRDRAGGLGPELGREIRARRRARGLTLAQLAARCGLSPTYLSELETAAEDNPTIGVLRALARGLEIPLGHLLPELGQPA